MLTSRLDEAFEYAHRLHQTQNRKGTAIPYISHLMIVAGLAIEAGGDEDQAIAGLLHDGPEDCGGEPTLQEIRRRFGDGVADMVADCTDAWTDPKPLWKPRKEAYLAHLQTARPSSLLVSLADKVHNCEAILSDYLQIGEPLWARFNGGREDTLWYYRSLADAFQRLLPCALANRLERAAKALEAAAKAR